MIVQSFSVPSATAGIPRSPSLRQNQTTTPANSADAAQTFQAMLKTLTASASTENKDARLAAIEAKGALSRTQEENDYVLAHDKRFAEIRDQGGPRTADELDYVQKAGGMVHSMENLSPAERALWDKANASGDWEAAGALCWIGMIRMGGHTANGAGGTTYDPLNTAITAANVEKYFQYGVIDSATGKPWPAFQALIRFLQANQAA
jgi:hypothetical protein